jgi:hypothetical protein
MKHVIVLIRSILVLPVVVLILATGVLVAGDDNTSSVQRKFISGGSIRMHLESGGYTIRPTDSANITVTCHAASEEQRKRVRVEIRAGGLSADVFVRDTPNNDFRAVIEVPRHSNLWVRLSAGELNVGPVEGDKNLEVRAGRLQVDGSHPEQYGHRDASVMTGSIEASAFHISKGGLFRSFEQEGPGKYRLHAHVMAGEIDLPGKD